MSGVPSKRFVLQSLHVDQSDAVEVTRRRHQGVDLGHTRCQWLPLPARLQGAEEREGHIRPSTYEYQKHGEQKAQSLPWRYTCQRGRCQGCAVTRVLSCVSNRRRHSHTNCDQIISLKRGGGQKEASPNRSSADSNKEVFSEARNTVSPAWPSFNSTKKAHRRRKSKQQRRRRRRAGIPSRNCQWIPDITPPVLRLAPATVQDPSICTLSGNREGRNHNPNVRQGPARHTRPGAPRPTRQRTRQAPDQHRPDNLRPRQEDKPTHTHRHKGRNVRNTSSFLPERFSSPVLVLGPWVGAGPSGSQPRPFLGFNPSPLMEI